MSRDRHHAIIVTESHEASVVEHWWEAVRIFDVPKATESTPQVTPIMRAPTNSWYTFMVAPDGSRERWDSSNIGDQNRAKFIEYLESTRCDWVCVQYGDDDGQTRIIDDSDKDLRGEE